MAITRTVVKYRGKHPRLIKEVFAGANGRCLLTSRDGDCVSLSAQETRGELPKLGDDIDVVFERFTGKQLRAD